MTDSSMNFGPAWIRNLRSEGTTGGGTGTAGTRYQLAEHRYGREEMLVLFDKTVKPPPTLAAFKALYSEQTLMPLALLETSEEEQRVWQSRPTSIGGPNRGRGVSLERGGRATRGRGNYPTYGRTPSAYDSGWGNGEQSDWSPRKDYNTRSNTTDNWRRVRSNEDDEGWRSMGTSRSLHEKWGRSTSWRGEGDIDERNGPPERGGRQSWHENNRNLTRRSWENEDHLPEWVNENPTEGGGTFDERGAFHGSDDEQIGGDNKTNKKELQKSASQQQIGNRNNHPPMLSTSKSAISLTKTEHDEKQTENLNERDKETSKIKESTSPEPEKPPSIADKSNTDDESDKSGKREEEPRSITTEKTNDNSNSVIIGNNNNTAPPQHPSSTNIDKVEEEFARMQEDLVLKLVIDEETPKTAIQNPSSSTTTVVTTTTNFDVTNTVQAPPPNLVPSVPTVPPPPLPPSQDKWYYQDPQGTRQGPFLNVEMAEWYKAGYFSNQLRVMRECDERYFLLGELINLCGGDNPFLSNIRFPILKNETPTKLNDDMLSYQLLSQLAFKQQISMRNLTEPWSALTLQQQELAAQRLLLQQQQQQQPPPPQQLPHDLQYMQQSAPPANPLMFMINQMQQSNKLHGSMLVDKPINSSSSSNSVPNPLDTLPVQLGGGIHSLQNRIPPQNLHNHILPTNLSTSLPSDSLNGGLPGLQTNNLPTPGLSTLPNLHSALPTGLNRPTSHSPIDQLPPPTNQENDPITNFLKQFHQQKQRAQMPLDGSMWHKPTNQFNVPQATAAAAAATTTSTQWAQQSDVPLSMWDLQPPPLPTSLSSDNQSVDNQQADLQQSQEVEKQQHQQQQQQQQRSKEDTSPKELKRKKEIDEKQVKKNAEEKRKQEQRRHEAEKKAAEEKRKKEEERIRKELERAKKEAEDKRMRELEEKRRLKEQRKAEEEAKKKSEELKKQEEEKLKREAKEREERKQAETRLIQNQAVKTAKAAPWSQSNSNQGMSLTDIQKAEKERRAQEAALLLKQQQLQEQQQQQQQQQAEKSSGIQLNWAKKPIEPKHVKSFAEIQAEEQERLAKMTAEARLAAQQREKEIPASNTNSIWNGQSLTWANATTTSQWSSNATTGFWDDILVKSSPKPSTVPKSSSTSAMSSVVSKQTPPPPQPTSQKQTKTKIKKDEPQKSVISNNNNNNSNSNNNNSANDEFTNWCYKTLSTISTNVDIPTFVSFLRDIESAYDVRDYCKEYLGDSAATQQFATNFLEKRRSFKPKINAHKDDMCSPAPAITPSTQHSTEFQEVKGKNKKNKKSKMLKVDSRILGFQVTSAPDRINVGDRDYGDNS